METYPRSVDVKSLDQYLKLIKLPHCPTGKVYINGVEAVMRRPGVFSYFNRALRILTYIEYDVNSSMVADVNIESLNEMASYLPTFNQEKVTLAEITDINT